MRDKIKESIFRRCKKRDISYPYEIANELSLELSLVHEALLELKKEGKVEVEQ